MSPEAAGCSANPAALVGVPMPESQAKGCRFLQHTGVTPQALSEQHRPVHSQEESVSLETVNLVCEWGTVSFSSLEHDLISAFSAPDPD